MDGVDLSCLPRMPKLRRLLAYSLCSAGLPLLWSGCAQWESAAVVNQPPAITARAAGDDEVLQLPDVKQETSPRMPTKTAVKPVPAPVSSKVLPINLDTVLHLAEVQNGQVAQARSKVEEAFAEKDLAAKAWLPAMNIGTEYTRHEGGIANENGTITRSSFSTLFGGIDIYSRLDLRNAVYVKVNAERQVWQQRGELRRITSESLLDATSTYIDLLTVRTGEAIAVSMKKDLQALLERAQNLAGTEPGARVEVARIQAQLKGRDQFILELQADAARASAKLAYLLGLDPCTTLVPVDERLVPLDLVDAGRPACDLVAQALANGPGIREMEGLLALVHESIERSKGPGKYLPIFEMRMLEGGFGTGPGDSQTWDNRWDFGVQVRWNLTDLLTAGERQRVLQAKTDQAHLAYQDLRGKLTLGVQESLETILSGRERIRLAEETIDEARKAHDLSDQRLKNNVERSSYTEVLLSLQTLAGAQISYLETLRSYDKAQLRLLVVLGLAGNSSVDGNCPNCCSKPQ
jgi:outer membrane protein TolC